jgi:hypothetical protein
VPHWKWRAQQFYCCVCICYCSNVSTEPLPSNDKGFLPSCSLATIWGIHSHTQTAMWSYKPTLFFSPLSLFWNKKFWEELIAYFPWYDMGHIDNYLSNNSYIVACVFVTGVTFLPSRCLVMIREILPRRCLPTIRGIHARSHTQQRDLISVLYLLAYFPWYDTGHIENDVSNNSSVVAYVFVTMVKFLPIKEFLPSHCLAVIGLLLPSRCLATIGEILSSRRLATIRGVLPSRCLTTIGRDTHTRTDKNVIS